MQSRRAQITVASDRSDLTQAIVAHLATAITCQTVSNPDFDPWITEVQLWVDDVRTDCTIAHVVTSSNRVSGVILMNTVLADGQDNVLEFVAISFDKLAGSSIWQEVLSTKEQHWLQNQGLVLHEMTNYLFLS